MYLINLNMKKRKEMGCIIRFPHIYIDILYIYTKKKLFIYTTLLMYKNKIYKFKKKTGLT